MHPVPVQISIMRKGRTEPGPPIFALCNWEIFETNKSPIYRVYDSVSGLLSENSQAQDSKAGTTGTNLGIKTPFSHKISKSPNG